MRDHLHILLRRAELMGMAATTFYTADMVRALPDDGNRYETVHGELLVTPAPRAWHQEIVGRLYEALRTYLRNRKSVCRSAGLSIPSDAALIPGHPRTRFPPPNASE